MNQDLIWDVNGEVYGKQRKTSDVLSCRFAPARRRLSFKDALHDTLQQVKNSYGTPAIMYSGGADSEMLIREFSVLGIRPDVHFVKFSNGSNQPDYETAVRLVEKLGLRLHVHNHSMEAFINSREHLDLAVKFHTSDLALVTVYKYAQHLGRAVMLGPELLLQKHQLNDVESDWFLIVGEHTFSEAAFRFQTRQPLLGELYYWNSDLLLCILGMSEIKDLVANRNPGRISLAYVKNKIWSSHLGYDFYAPKKRHGYEGVYQSFRKAVNEMKAALPFVQSEIKVPYQKALHQLELGL